MSKKIDEREVLDTDNPVVNDEWKDKITFPKHYEKVASKLTKKQLNNYRNIPGWINDAEWMYFEIFGSDFDRLKGGEHFVEIGTLLGQSSIRMAELMSVWHEKYPNRKRLKFDSIDTFYFIIHGIRNGEHPPKFLDYINLYKTGDIMHILLTQLNKLGLGGLVNYICSDSKYAHHIYRENSLDFVWVDGGHTEEDVEQDVKNFWPKIKPGGLIAGDDYLYEGVRLKVHEFVKKHRDEISEFAHPDLKKENTGNFFKIYKKITYEK